MNSEKYRIFVSFSKHHAKKIAEALKGLLDEVFKSKVDVFVSDDHSDGVQITDDSRDKIHEMIKKSNMGICILTKINFGEPWLMYEAGGLMVSTEKNVMLLLVDRDRDDREQPFKSRDFERYDKNAFYDRIIRVVYNSVNKTGIKKGTAKDTGFKNSIMKHLSVFDRAIKNLQQDQDYKVQIMQYTAENTASYYTRQKHLRDLTDNLAKSSAKRIIIVGTPSDILKDAKKFIAWAKENPTSKLFICSENRDLLLERQGDAAARELRIAECKVGKKIKEIEVLRGQTSKIKNIFCVDINNRCSTYVTIHDTNIFLTPAINQRSSKTFTYSFPDKQKNIEILRYVGSRITGESEEAGALTNELDAIEGEIKGKK